MAMTQLRGGSTSLASQVKDASIFDLQLAGGIQDGKLASGANWIKKDGSVVFTADQAHGISDSVSASNFKITRVADPINPQDAATRAWVLTQVAGGPTTSATAKAATTLSITLSGTQSVDGVALSVADVCLVKNQATPASNGLYTVQSGAWTRTPGMDTWVEVPGVLVSVQQGTQADTLWLSTADAGGTLGTTSITFVQMPGPSDMIAGAGLLRTGQTVDVQTADNSLTINADSLQVKLDPARAVTVVAAGIGVNLEGTNPTLQVTTNQLGVKLDTGTSTGAIVTSAAGIRIATNNSLIVATNLLRVDGSVCLYKTDLIIRESVAGSGANYTLANVPVAGSEMIFLNGLLQEPGAGNDYTIASQAITFLTATVAGDRVRATYTKGAAGTIPT